MRKINQKERKQRKNINKIKLMLLECRTKDV